MPLWGANTTNEAKPAFLTNAQKDNCFATPQGWVLRHDKGGGRYWDEILVGAGSLDTTFANANITAVFFSTAANNSFQLTFTGITGNTAFANGETITQGANTGTVVFSNSTVVHISSATGVMINTSNATTQIVGGTSNGTANVSNVVGLAAYTRGFANAFVTVAFNEKVDVVGVPTLNVVGGSANATASYNSGSGTNKLVFKFTVPAQAQTLTLMGSAITTNSTVNIVDSGNTSVNAAVIFANSVVFPVSRAASGTANVAVI